MLTLRSTLVALAATLLLAAAPAWSLTIDLSEMTSEQEEIDDGNDGTPASVLDAQLTIELSGNDLTITIDNNTSGGSGAGDYDISEIWLNLSGVTVTSVSPPGAGSGATSEGWDLAGSSGVAGFGTFSVGLVVHGDVNENDDRVTAGEQDVALTLTCAGGDCSGWSLASTTQGKIVAAKFINGGSVNGDDNDSAFGASGTGAVVPEPSAAWLIGLALAGLAARRTR